MHQGYLPSHMGQVRDLKHFRRHAKNGTSGFNEKKCFKLHTERARCFDKSSSHGSHGHAPAAFPEIFGMVRSEWFDTVYFILRLFIPSCAVSFSHNSLSRPVQWGSVSTPPFFQHMAIGLATLLRRTSTFQTLPRVSLSSRSLTFQSLPSCSTCFAN